VRNRAATDLTAASAEIELALGADIVEVRRNAAAAASPVKISGVARVKFR
jgi:hypothetical protein